MIVVDASLAAKWLLPEPGSMAALRFLAQPGETLIAPDLVASEVAGSLVRRANADKSLGPMMLLANAKWLALLSERALDLHRSEPEDVARAAALAIDLGHPLKDCLYLVLAMEQGCPLLTCDARFVEKAQAIWSDVRLFRNR